MDIMNKTRDQIQSREHISIDIAHPSDSLVASIKEKMESAASLVNICRVNEQLRRENKAAYCPDEVSIGPFHHGEENLSEMEKHKWRYLFALLNQGANLESSLDKCVKALRELEHRTRKCYGEDIALSSNEFVEMMLVDAGFIIELLIKFANRSLRRRGDPIFSTPGKLFNLRHDMILLENQIPLFVIQRLFLVAPVPKECNQPLGELVFRFFRNMIPGDHENLREKFNEEAHHLLDMIHNCLLPATYTKICAKEGFEQRNLKRAYDLQKAGVKFKRAYLGSLVDMEFSNGVFYIHQLKVDECTERLLRNLIVFEQCQSVNRPCVTSYASLMHSLVSTDKDAKVLKERNIIVFSMESEKKVTDLLSDLVKDVSVRDFYYEGLCQQINEYSKVKRHWKRLESGRKARRINPRSRFVIILASLVVLLIFLGALFSVISFFRHHH